jgi:hypothetical protein
MNTHKARLGMHRVFYVWYHMRHSYPYKRFFGGLLGRAGWRVLQGRFWTRVASSRLLGHKQLTRSPGRFLHRTCLLSCDFEVSYELDITIAPSFEMSSMRGRASLHLVLRYHP